jgi:hypothetical protein
MAVLGWNLYRILKTVHGWLGFIILPWIVLYGLTGFYLNHSRTISGLFDDGNAVHQIFPVLPRSQWLDVPKSKKIAAAFWSNEAINEAKAVSYHGNVAIQFSKPSGRIYVAVRTGHYYQRGRFFRVTYSPEGKVVQRKIYWNNLARYFHEVGWIDNRFGVLLADIIAFALVVFGISGVLIFLLPKARKLHYRLKRRVPVGGPITD